MTNREYWERLTDEEFAETLTEESAQCDFCVGRKYGSERCKQVGSCYKGVLSWLKQEVGNG